MDDEVSPRATVSSLLAGVLVSCLALPCTSVCVSLCVRERERERGVHV